ncbi:MAG TPA: VWA domain-containing protein [Cytophagaceae bacterium]|nr:VWA domain-containing protein [Cytophagaceae bacterium]
MHDSIWEWFSWQWFSPELVRNFHWENQIFLLLVPAVPLLFILRWLFYFPIRQKFDVALPASELRKWTFIPILRLIPISLQMLSVMFAIIALARPQSVSERIDQFSEGINILLAVDVSESMKLEDFRPNRLEAARDVARKFVAGRSHDRIGLVVFAGDAYSLSPLTNDHDLVANYLSEMNFSMIENTGTSIGNAIGVGINRLNESSSTKGAKIMILMSDGENTSGLLDPITAAKLAYAYNIKIYTIGIGKEGEVSLGRDSTGKKLMVRSHLDETLLRKIAEQTKGNYFRATNNNALTDIFLTIDKLEKGKMIESRYKDTKDFYQIYLSWAIFFFLLWMLLKNTFMNNFLED